ncbi:carboxyl transferase domain-containing protein [Herbidospora sp. NBRC 101105]|uniref:acyl-CoA carboxylase subunit beta n=1 Tax=Herbidospora sp. NBRC 101105 TaxID=3032195 RepID=UPI0024A24B3B|nr:propionyl-CoA carboxylase subunit beta [Herbidospora sp. NBRC 101105]
MTTMPIVEIEMDHRAPSVRLARLLDPGSAVPLHADDESGVQAVCGRVDGSVVVAYCTDATRMGGALGGAGAERVVEAIGAAERLGCPVIGLWHSGGARLADGVESMHGVGRMFAAMTRVSGVIPQISVVLGPAAGAAAYGPALTDIVIMAEDARIFITGPEIVRSVTGERIDMAGLGGPGAHGPKSGVAHLVANGEEEAYEQARRLTGVFTRPGSFDLGALAEGRDLAAILPDSPRRAYDVRPLVRAIVDEGFLELQPRWAGNILVGLGRLGGRSVGVLANNPIRKGGCLDTLSAEKAARFVRMCDALGVPLVVVVDVPGYLPGVAQEWDGVVRRGAKLLHAFAESVVPRVTLITRKSYGGAYIAMNSRSLGATAVFAWPDAEVAVMGAESAVGILHRKALAAAPEGERAELRARLTQEHLRVSGGVERALALGVVDEVIAPETTRLRLAEALDRAPHARGRHGNIPL